MARGRARTLLGVLLAVAVPSVVPALAVGQVAPGCPQRPSDDIETSPGNGARDVALNASIRVRVPDDDRPSLQLFREVPETDAGVPDAGPSVTQVPVPARWERIDDSEYFVVTPVSLLEPESEYTLTVFTATGGTAEPTFTTVDVIDDEPPTFSFGPDEVIDYSTLRIRSECDAEPGSYLATVNVPHVTDDGADGSVEILLYLTRAAGLDAPALVARMYNGQDQTPLSFVLTPEQMATPVCVMADAIDGLGRHADPENLEEFCFDPLQGNFFEPCDVAGPLQSTQHGALFVTLMGALWALGVRRRRLIPLPNRDVTQR